MLLVAFLLTAHDRWRDAEIHLLIIVENDEEQIQALTRIQQVLMGARVEARPRVILREGRPIPEIIHCESAAADLAHPRPGPPPAG